MTPTFYLEIVTPERMFFSGDVEMVSLRTLDGEIGILANHAPMVIAVSVGPLRLKQDGEWLEGVVSEGFMEVKQNKTIILADTAEWPHEIDKNRAEDARKRAEERLHRKLSYVEHVRSEAALTRAMARLKVTKDIR